VAMDENSSRLGDCRGMRRRLDTTEPLRKEQVFTWRNNLDVQDANSDQEPSGCTHPGVSRSLRPPSPSPAAGTPVAGGFCGCTCKAIPSSSTRADRSSSRGRTAEQRHGLSHTASHTDYEGRSEGELSRCGCRCRVPRGARPPRPERNSNTSIILSYTCRAVGRVFRAGPCCLARCQSTIPAPSAPRCGRARRCRQGTTRSPRS